MIKHRFGSSKEDTIVFAICTGILIFILITTLYPVYYCLIYSLNEGSNSILGNLYLYPRKLTIENYLVIFREKSLISAFTITVARTLIGTIMSLYVMSIASYALTKPQLKFRKTYTMIGIISIYFSGGLIPFYIVLNNLKLLNTFWVFIFPSLVSFFNVLLLMAFFRELPSSLEESAQMDGAGYITIFHQLIIPLSKPILATIGLFVAVGHWNDWFSAAFYVTDEKLITMPTLLMKMMNEAVAKSRMESFIKQSYSKSNLTIESVRYAALMVTIMPIVMVYPFLQKYFVKGMMVGAIKA